MFAPRPRWLCYDVLLKMKILTLLLPLFIINLLSCSSTRLIHLDALEFQQQAKRIEQPNSLLKFTYIGSSTDRSYLEQIDSLTLRSQPTTTVFWTELNNLPADIKTQLNSGKSPWKPWNQKGKITIR